MDREKYPVALPGDPEIPDSQALRGRARTGRFRNLPCDLRCVSSARQRKKSAGEMRTRISAALAVFILAGIGTNTVPAHAGVDVNVNLGIPVGMAVAPAPVV